MDWAEGSFPPIGVEEGQETRGGRTECSGWGVGFVHSLKVDWRGSSSCYSVGKYHGLVVDVSFDWKPVERGDCRGAG